MRFVEFLSNKGFHFIRDLFGGMTHSICILMKWFKLSGCQFNVSCNLVGFGKVDEKSLIHFMRWNRALFFCRNRLYRLNHFTVDNYFDFKY